jgi:hypothetical protein
LHSAVGAAHIGLQAFLAAPGSRRLSAFTLSHLQMRFREHHWPVADASGFAAFVCRTIAALSLAVLSGVASPWTTALQAQPATGWIVISSPSAWSNNRMLSVTAGSTVRVVGQAFHTSGIRAVTVAGEPADIRPGARGVVDFEAALVVPAGVPSVAVVAIPTSGEPLGRSFTVRVLGGPAPGPPPSARFNAGGAAVLSLFVPGLGQVYTRRPLLGALFLGVGAGAAATGLLYKETTVRCLSPLVDGYCPLGEELSRSEETPYLIAGLGVAGAMALVAAIEAYVSANRLNAQELERTGEVPSWLAHASPLIDVSPQGLTLGIRLTR